MEQHCHVVGIVGSIESRNIEQTLPSHAVPKAARVQRGESTIQQLARDTLRIRARDVDGRIGIGENGRNEEAEQAERRE